MEGETARENFGRILVVKIYIPQHLKKLGIFRDLALMVSAYQESYKPEVTSFDDYQSYMKIDPVLRFVSFCIKEEDQPEDYQSVLDYVTRLFYSVRGTRRVFVYMERYLGIKFVGKPVYNIKTISFSITEKQDWYDVSLFNSYLLDFLNHLLYYESLSYKVDLGLSITGDLDFYYGVGIKTYKIYKI